MLLKVNLHNISIMNYTPARSVPSLFAILKNPASHVEMTGLANLGTTQRFLYKDDVNKSLSDLI